MNNDGGLTVNAGANLTIDGFVNATTFTVGTVSYALGAIYALDSGSVGMLGGDFTLTNSGTLTLKNNKADGVTNSAIGTGGAISSTGKIDITNTGSLTFDGNEATGTGGFGGAIAAVENITISGNGTHTFSSNKATTNGGAIFSQSGHVSITSGAGSATFNGNQAGTAGLNASGGGAIYASQVTLNKTGGGNITFTNNKAGEFGGAILIYNAPTSSVANSINGATFTTNESGKRGGAIYIVNTATSATNNAIKNSLFDGNKITAGIDNQDGGGAIYTKSALTIIDTDFKNNTVTGTGNGGAIYAEKELVIKAETANVTFSGNKVNGIANDIHLAGADASATFNATSGKSITLGGVTGNGNVVISGAGKTIVTADTSQSNAALLNAGTLTFANGGILSVQAKAVQLQDIVAGAAKEFYFAGTNTNVTATAANIDFSNISSLVYSTTYNNNTAFISIARN